MFLLGTTYILIQQDGLLSSPVQTFVRPDHRSVEKNGTAKTIRAALAE